MHESRCKDCRGQLQRSAVHPVAAYSRREGPVLRSIDTTAVAGDVAKGKKFYTADGELVEGTASGSLGDSRKSITVIQKSIRH